jgi:hypothetical protein
MTDAVCERCRDPIDPKATGADAGFEVTLWFEDGPASRHYWVHVRCKTEHDAQGAT